LLESCFFVPSTETPTLLEKRDHLIREGRKTLGINIHKQIEAGGGTSSTHFFIKSTICSGVPTNR
jgi:hypothetical protein